MTNNQFCSFIGVAGCLVGFLSLGLMFFGVTTAVWGAAAGAALAGIGLIGFD